MRWRPSARSPFFTRASGRSCCSENEPRSSRVRDRTIFQTMTDAVIVALGRSPVGRARKGSLVDVRPDDLAAYVVTKVLEKVPELDRGDIEDLICGCGVPGGEEGHKIGRVVCILP